jgi:hypothetical protein
LILQGGSCGLKLILQGGSCGLKLILQGGSCGLKLILQDFAKLRAVVRSNRLPEGLGPDLLHYTVPIPKKRNKLVTVNLDVTFVLSRWHITLS